MSRIIQHTDFPAQSNNLLVLNTKHTADGIKSMLNSFLTENEIDLSEDMKAKAIADTAEATRLAIVRKLSSDKKDINNLMGKPFTDMKSGAQFLKKLYKNNATKLKLWGIEMGVANNIIYPTDDHKKVDLVSTFWTYHGSFAAGKSPLQNFIDNNKIDAPTYITNTATAITNFATYQQNVTLSEQQRELRDSSFATPWEHTKSIGTYLNKLNVHNPKDTCNWGFNVLETSHVQAVRKSKLAIGAKLTVGSIVLDTSFTNTGTDDLHLFKGKVAKGTPAIIHAGEHYVLSAGHSQITIVNPSPTTKGKFEVIRNK